MGTSACQVATCGTFNSSTMMVMMIAITASLNASNRLLVTVASSLARFQNANDLPFGFAVLNFFGGRWLNLDALTCFDQFPFGAAFDLAKDFWESHGVSSVIELDVGEHLVRGLLQNQSSNGSGFLL